MYFDNNWFLSLEADISNPKIYTHTIGWQLLSHTDHLVLVWHKQEIKVINRKDLGKTMMLLRSKSVNSKDNASGVHNMLTLFSGFDEHTGQSYYFFPRIHGAELMRIADSLWTLHTIDQGKGRFTISKESPDEHNLLYKLFVLFVIGGTALIKGDNLLSLKIQISIPTPLFARKEVLEGLVHDLHLIGYSLSGYFIEQKNGWVYEITTNDYDILPSLQERDKSLASVQKITTKELAEQVQSQLFEQYPDSKTLLWNTLIKLFEVK